MIIFHDKDGNRLAFTEAEALALGYTYEHIWKRVNPKWTSLNVNKLIEFQGDKASEARAKGFSGERFMQTATMLRQQQANLKDADKYALELERLYEDAKARIEALKQVLQSIANEHVELSHDKIRWQCDDHIRWAKEALK